MTSHFYGTEFERQGGESVESTLVAVTSRREAETLPDALGLWIAEVGEDYVTSLVEATRSGIAEGTIPMFADKEPFLEHLTRATSDKPARPGGS